MGTRRRSSSRAGFVEDSDEPRHPKNKGSLFAAMLKHSPQENRWFVHADGNLSPHPDGPTKEDSILGLMIPTLTRTHRDASGVWQHDEVRRTREEAEAEYERRLNTRGNGDGASTLAAHGNVTGVPAAEPRKAS